ncbi:Transposon TX1 uncharacterized 149 kDa protein [Linum perenne]
MVETFEDISKVAVEFYKKLLGSNHQVNVEGIAEVVKRKLNDQQSASLTAAITDNEIKVALFSIANEKAPGRDGYSALFFKESWEIVQVDLILALRRFFDRCSMPKYVNSILLAHIPKKFNAADMKDYRPISCCNVVYKVISKVLSNRLSAVLPSLISPAQTAFIKGRYIGDGILLAHEMLRGYTRSGISPRCAMKIDLMKVFDSVEWTFVFETLKAMNFPL